MVSVVMQTSSVTTFNVLMKIVILDVCASIKCSAGRGP
jgi:hypothetical protein